MRLSLILTLTFMSCLAIAQKHDNIWLAGYSSVPHTKIDFSTQPPTLTEYASNINLESDVAFFSDSLGKELLFYTNGLQIFNRDHQIMAGGDTINFGQLWMPDGTGYSSNKNSFAIPNPQEDSTYYLIHMRLDYSSFLPGLLNDRISYSKIDTRQVHGLGRVTEANVVLTSGNFTHATVIKHGNGRDWWLVCPERDSRNVFRYLFSKDGISGPFLQVTTFQFSEPEEISPILASPDGQTIIKAVHAQGFIIYNFDRCTGLLSNTRVIYHPHSTYIYDLSISSDNRFLYFTDPLHLNVMDLKAEFLIPKSLDTIARFDGFWQLAPVYTSVFYQHSLAPDGKIYFSTGNGTEYMHVMHAPQLPGQACDFEQRGLKLISWYFQSIPAYVNYRLGVFGNNCPQFKPEDIPEYVIDTSGFQVLNPEISHHSKLEKTPHDGKETFFYLMPDGSTQERH